MAQSFRAGARTGATALALLLVFALLPDLGAFTRALTHVTPPPAEAHH